MGFCCAMGALPLSKIATGQLKRSGMRLTCADPIQRRSGIIHENVTGLIGQELDFRARNA